MGRSAGPLFSIASFEALRRLRLQAYIDVRLELHEVAALILRTDPDATGLDFDSSIELHRLVPGECSPDEPLSFYRVCAFHALVAADLSWSRAITLGRRRFHDLLSRDERVCLREAKLMDEPPDDEIIDWWDRASEAVRRQVDGQKHGRGRIAERLTMLDEASRLVKEGIPEVPKWIAIDDNTAGYDILSYRLTTERDVSPLLIEVKSSVASPLRFFVTRNEWKKAVEFGEAYLFHVWDLSVDPPRLHRRTVAQVTPHIPVDQLQGSWATAVIPLAAQ